MIAAKTWREIRVMLVVYFLLLELLLAPVVLLWPDLYGDLTRSTLLRGLPLPFVQDIGNTIGHRDEETAYRGWIALMLYFRSVNLVGIAASVLMGTALFAREREAHTFEFLLARPVSRSRILWQKFWPTALAVVAPIFLANWSAIAWSRHIDMELPFWPLTVASLHGATFVLAFLAFTTFVSVRCRVQAHVAFWVGGITVFEIGIYLVPRLRRTSIMHLSDFDVYGPILAGNRGLRDLFDPVSGDGTTTWVLLAALVFYLLALQSLRRLEP